MRSVLGWSATAGLLVLLACGQEGGGGGGGGGAGGDGGTPPSTAGRLHASDLAYSGAFRLPADFDWGARGIALGPRGALWVTGPDVPPATFGEVSLPAPVRTRDWTTLPEAALLSPVRVFDGSLIETQLEADTTFGGDLAYVPAQGSQTGGKVYGCADWWFAVGEETFPTVWFAEEGGSRPRGLFHVGRREPPFHGNRSGDYLFAAPRGYADAHLGGRWLVTGKTRGAFGGSMGPTLLAFAPWEEEDPSGDLDAVALLWYPERFPECAGPNVGDKAACDFPDFTMCDDWEGAGFVEGSAGRAVILWGVKGLGGNRYGPPEPGDCNPHQGYHCDPFERQVIFYDPEELAEVAAGRRDAWTVRPYETWRPAEMFLASPTCGLAGGLAVDPDAGRVLLVEKGLGEGNSAVVHVWTFRTE